MTKIVNYGKLLKKAIKEKGLKKKFVYEELGISKPTLNTRLKDGCFTEEQIEKIKSLWLI